MRPSVFHQSKRNCRRPPESWAGKGQTRRRALEQHSVTGAEHAAPEATQNPLSSPCVFRLPPRRISWRRLRHDAPLCVDPPTDGFGVNLTAAG